MLNRPRPSLLILFLALLTAAPAPGADRERRTFAVAIAGKPAGTYQMVIQKNPDGSVGMAGAADVSVKILLNHYRYTYRGTELWKDGRLVKLESTCDDDGKRQSVVATGGEGGATVRTAGREVFVRGDVWPTTYWQLPPENARGASLVLVDADSGRAINARLDRLGAEDVGVGGQGVRAVHYRLTGGVKVDLWYDGSGRLVRLESVEEGQKYVLELSRLQRE